MSDGVKINFVVSDRRSRLKRWLGRGKTTENVEVVLYDQETGEVRGRERIHNTVTTAGKNGIADQILAAPSLGKPTHMAIGTGAPAANALGAEVARVALTSKTRSTNVVTMVGDFPAGTPAGTNIITEAGIADAGAVGNFWTTVAFGGQSKDPSLAMTINWTLTIN